MNKKWYIVAGVILSIILVLVFYGVLTHKEPGFLKVCWDSKNAAHYVDEDESRCNPTDLVWDKKSIPLTIYLDFNNEAKRNFKESFDEAVKLWNSLVGKVFVVVDNREKASVVVKWDWAKKSYKENESAGSTFHIGSYKRGPVYCEVVIREFSDVHAVFRYIAHELGHVLGLAHDEEPRTIMYPIHPSMTDEITFIKPSDSDIKLLRKTYLSK